MKEIPILYSTPMVQAKLDGRKTQTRRIINPQPSDNWMEGTRQFSANGSMFDSKGKQLFWLSGGNIGEIKPKYKPGDILWARESWRKSIAPDGETTAYYFKADDSTLEAKWKPSIHMPKNIARIWERVTDVRVERLQDISPGDAVAEGIEYDNVDAVALAGGELVADFTNYMWRDDPEHESYWFPHYASCIDSYFSLWDSINGEGAWKLNPWVWVITTEILSTTGRPEEL